MTLLAINYSHPAAALVAAGQLPLDRFKTPDWPDMIAEAQPLRPVAVHFTLTAGTGRLDRIDWGLVERLKATTHTPYINLHLECDARKLNHIPIDSLRPVHTQEVLERMIADLQFAAQRFGAENIIAENCPYRPTGHLPAACAAPDIIVQALEAVGCGLLFDIAHARISALSLGMDPHTYMSQLPMERMREMHFTGMIAIDGWLQDHRPATDDDWADLDFCLGHIRSGDWPRPWMTAFEYGGVGGKFTENSDPQVIAAQGQRLAALIAQI
jgi:uncharacterized protein (UPF0276 family)